MGSVACSERVSAMNGIGNKTNIGKFQYTGQITIPELGLYHYKARVYSPTLGRFLQTDPIGYEDQVNLYAYVYNDPVNVTDSSGACPRCLISGGKILIKSAIKRKRPDKVGLDELAGAADDISTIASDPFSLDALAAGVDLVVGTEFNNPKAKAASGASSVKTVKVSRSASPEAARHLKETGAVGRTLTVDRAGRD